VSGLVARIEKVGTVGVTASAVLAASVARAAAWAIPPTEARRAVLAAHEALPATTHHMVGSTGELHVSEWGAGPPIVLVHGFTSNSGDWWPLVPSLVEAGLRVLAIDLPGHGSSRGGRGAGIDVFALGDQVAAVVEHFELHDAVLAGHSLGGSAILAMAGCHPDLARDRVRHLVPMAATPSIRRPPEVATVLLGANPASPLLLVNPLTGRSLMQLAAFAPTATTGMIDEARMRWSTCPVAVRMSYAGVLGDDLRPVLARIPVPVTAVVGSADRMCPPSRGRMVAGLVPDGRVHVVEGAGHPIPTERPAETARILLDVAGRPAGSSTVGR
jgi:non-heme chloroperoxidase